MDVIVASHTAYGYEILEVCYSEVQRWPLVFPLAGVLFPAVGHRRN